MSFCTLKCCCWSYRRLSFCTLKWCGWSYRRLSFSTLICRRRWSRYRLDFGRLRRRSLSFCRVGGCLVAAMSGPRLPASSRRLLGGFFDVGSSRFRRRIESQTRQRKNRRCESQHQRYRSRTPEYPMKRHSILQMKRRLARKLSAPRANSSKRVVNTYCTRLTTLWNRSSNKAARLAEGCS